jgi:hypothetical protein
MCDTAAMAMDPAPTPEEASSGEDPPHDILAAEEFAVPAPDPALHHPEPVLLPDDPTGIAQPHDVLAAEEFPIPAVAHRPSARQG